MTYLIQVWALSISIGALYRLVLVSLEGSMIWLFAPPSARHELVVQVAVEALASGGALLAFDAAGRLRRRQSGGWMRLGLGAAVAGLSLAWLLDALDHAVFPEAVPLAWGLAGAGLAYAYLRSLELRRER